MPQQLAQDEAGNIWEVDARGNPVRLHLPASKPSQGVRIGTPNPYTLPKDAADLAAKRQEAILRDLDIRTKQQKLANGGSDIPPPPGDLTKQGDEYLATLPAGMAPQVRAILDGRTAPGMSRSSPLMQKLMEAAAQADPTFDASQYASRVKLRQAYTSQAPNSPASVITSLNTLAGHANQLWENHLHMAGPNIGPLSGVAAGALQSFDQKYKPAYDTTVGFVQGELQKLVKNGQSSEAEADRIIHNLRSAQSFEARTSAIKAVVDLAESKITPIRQGWSAVMGDRPMPNDVSPASMAVFDNILNEGKKSVAVDHFGTPIVPGSTDKQPPVTGPLPPGGSPPSGPGGGPTDNLGTPKLPLGGPQNIAFNLDSTPDQPPVGYRYTPSQESDIAGALRRGDVAGAAKLSETYSGYKPDAVTMAGLTSAAAALKANPNAKVQINYSNVDAPLRRQWEQDRYGSHMPDALQESATHPANATLRSFNNTLLPFGLGPRTEAALTNPFDYNDSLKKANALAAADSTEQPWPSFTGNVLGVGGQALLTHTALGAAGDAVPGRFGAALRNPITSDVATGLLQSTDGQSNPLVNTLASVGGGSVGRSLAKGGGMLGRRLGVIGQDAPAPLSPAEQMIASTAQNQGVDDIRRMLTQAASDNVPMALADTGRPLNSITGAAVRRSPAADQIAQDALLARSRGQVDRFNGAINNTLGPTANVPQLSADLERQAATAASPLYDAFRAEPPIGTPNLDNILKTPFAQKSLNEAHTIIANRRQNPSAFGFRLGNDGNVALNPVPVEQHAAYASAKAEYDAAAQAVTRAETSLTREGAAAARERFATAQQKLDDATRALSSQPSADSAQVSHQFLPGTMDLVTQGMNAHLYRPSNLDAFGRLNLKGPAAAELGVKNDFLKEMDSLYPNTYPQARSAYGGPMQSRDALQLGQDAIRMQPNELGIGIANKSPEQLGQIRLGFRSGLVDQANNMRFSADPFRGILSTPAAEQRLGTVFSDNPKGVSDLLRIRDSESQLARSTNDILGNSKTAQRQIADQSFAEGELPQMLFDAGLNMATGQVPTSLLLKKGVGTAIKDAWKFGVGKRAVAKADAAAPLLLNTDSQDALATLGALLDRAQARQDYIGSYNRRIARPVGMFGSSVATAPFLGDH
jgi:hypothetical protein